MKNIWIKLHSAVMGNANDGIVAKGRPIYVRRSEVEAIVRGRDHGVIHLSSGTTFAVAENAYEIGELMGREAGVRSFDDDFEVIE